MNDQTKTLPKNGMRPIHPGEILKTEYLDILGISAKTFSEHSQIEVSIIENIIAGKQSINDSTAHLLAVALNTTIWFWINLQNRYDDRKMEILANDDAILRPNIPISQRVILLFNMLHILCRKHECNYTLNYNETCNEWSVSLEEPSVRKSECRDSPLLEHALERAIEILEKWSTPS